MTPNPPSATFRSIRNRRSSVCPTSWKGSVEPASSLTTGHQGPACSCESRGFARCWSAAGCNHAGCCHASALRRCTCRELGLHPHLHHALERQLDASLDHGDLAPLEEPSAFEYRRHRLLDARHPGRRLLGGGKVVEVTPLPPRRQRL